MAFLRSLGVVLVIGLVIAALVGYRFMVENRFTAEEVVEKSFATEPAPRVFVETFNGTVEVVTIPEARVEARLTKRASASSQEAADIALEEIAVTMTQEGNTVRILARRPEQFWGTGDRSAAVHVQVPANAVLDLRTSNGKVEATGPTGAVTAQTSNGAITIKGSRGELKLTTSNGNILADGGRGQIELRTSNGKIDIKSTEARVNARTSNGAINCEAALAPGEHRLQCSNGRITVTLPGESSFHLDARTSNGKITSTFDVKKTGKPHKRRLQGQVGTNPTLSLYLETSNGSIEIRKQ